MSKDVKIIIAAHKPFNVPKDREMYLPIHVGSYGKDSIGFQRDDEFDNISSKNPYYCELTGLYWAWKNLDNDYIGLVHYRRYFAKKNKKYSENLKIDEIILDKEDVSKFLDENDVIVPKKRKYYIESLYSHYAHTFDARHLDITRELISKQCPEYLTSFEKVMQQRSGYMFNMFIMKKELLNEYLTWLFPILDNLFEQVPVENLTPFEARLFGRVSERLFNVWLDYKKIVPKEVPFVYLEKINYINKAKSFLEAKFFGKKYGQSF